MVSKSIMKWPRQFRCISTQLGQLWDCRMPLYILNMVSLIKTLRDTSRNLSTPGQTAFSKNTSTEQGTVVSFMAAESAWRLRTINTERVLLSKRWRIPSLCTMPSGFSYYTPTSKLLCYVLYSRVLSTNPLKNGLLTRHIFVIG